MNPRDHRRLGRELGYFCTDESCGAGLPLWLPAGAIVRSELERFIVDLERRNGYQHVYSPMLGKVQLYERSGHWSYFRDDMYPPMGVGSEQTVLRPMNCPHHILVFGSEARTHRDVPFRVAELGTMFRLERSGVVGGLSRVRQMTLNDGHVFCAPQHIGPEISRILAMVEEAYGALCIPAPSYRLSLAGEGAKHVGDVEGWNRSEAMLRSALDGRGVSYTEARGEAAFYGPKIDLQVRDVLGREETLSTVQLDFQLPQRFGLSYQNGSEREQPLMIHRSIISTMERMVAHLLEVHDGRLPVWLAPVQIIVVPTSITALDYASSLRDELCGNALRVEVDDRQETLGARIRDAHRRRIPYVAVVGEREAAAGTVALRLGDGGQSDMGTADLLRLLARVIAERSSGRELPDPRSC